MMRAHGKKRLYEILELAAPGDVPSHICDTVIISLVVLNTLAVIVVTVPNLSSPLVRFLDVFETCSVVVFTIEYLLRLWSCTADARYAHPVTGRVRFMGTPLALIDLMALIPFYLPLILDLDVRFILALRLFRLFRLFKMSRYSTSMRLFGAVLHQKREELILAMFFVTLLLIFASSGMYFVEHTAQPQAFSSIPAAMWWGIATLTTVGYGDIYPITPFGKLLGSIIALLGIGLFALPAGILASGFAEAMERRRRIPLLCPHCGKALGGASSTMDA